MAPRHPETKDYRYINRCNLSLRDVEGAVPYSYCDPSFAEYATAAFVVQYTITSQISPAGIGNTPFFWQYSATFAKRLMKESWLSRFASF